MSRFYSREGSSVPRVKIRPRIDETEGCISVCGGDFISHARSSHSLAQEQKPSDIVFQIGSFNRSSMEFNQGTPSQAVTFIAGQSNPKNDWYAVRPVRFLGAAGTPESIKNGGPRTIIFSLPNAPAPAYRFHIAILIETSCVPALRIGINGKHGVFYLRPELDKGMGNSTTAWFFVYSHADVQFAFSGAFLHKGQNMITIEAVEDAAKGVAGASLTYDALQLASSVEAIQAEQAFAQIVPTIFYQRRQNQLGEMVDVFVRHGKRIEPGSNVDLTIASRRYQQSLKGGQDFGEEKLEFFIPEFPPKTRAQLTWNADGHARYDELTIDPEKKWTLFVVPNVHLDIGFTDYQAKVAALQSRVIDQALDLVDKYPDFRFSIDGAWSVEQFLRTRTPADQQRLIAAAQKQEIFVPPQYADLLMGFPTAETLIRSLYAGANFSRIHGTPFNYVSIEDTPTYTWSYASIVASAGIEYLMAGGNNIRAPVWLQGHLTESSPLWWEGPDGKKVLLWYSRHYEQVHYLFGMPPEISAGRDTLPLFLQMYNRPGYLANATIVFGTQIENTDLFPQQAELARNWNSIFEYPHLQYSGFHDALQNIAAQFGDNILTIRGDGGPYWDDSVAADAYYTAMERENESRAPSAEKLATLSSLTNPLVAADKAKIDRMWMHMVVMDEHCSGSWDSLSNPTGMENVRQLAVKEFQATQAHELADTIARNSMASIADSISAGENSLIVFNTLNWKRSGTVEIDLSGQQEIEDLSTGAAVPIEILHTGINVRHVRFVAQNVPAVGYKVFLLRPTAKPSTNTVGALTTTLETPYYLVELDPVNGAIRSIYDKELKKELVNQASPYRFGQYIYVTGGDVPLDQNGDYRLPINSLLDYPGPFPPPELQVHPAHNGKLISVAHVPLGWVARMESADTNTPAIISEIRLSDHEKKIEFIEDVNKKEVDSKEAVYFAFPFAMDRPQFQYEIQTAVVDPTKDMYPGAGHEWFSVQHWVSVQQNGVSATVMPLDASLVMLGDINRGAWPSQFGERSGTIFSNVMNNYWYTNYRGSQGGQFRFRYVITSAPSTNPADLTRMGWEEITPLEANQVISQDRASNTPRPLDGKQDSFLNIEDGNLLLETWKPAEDGNGTILRFLDLGGAQRLVAVKTRLVKVTEAWQTDAVERNTEKLTLLGENGFQFAIHPHEIVTVRLLGENVLPAPKY